MCAPVKSYVAQLNYDLKQRSIILLFAMVLYLCRIQNTIRLKLLNSHVRRFVKTAIGWPIERADLPGRTWVHGFKASLDAVTNHVNLQSGKFNDAIVYREM